MTDLIGRTIKQYRLDSLLGDGGMGTVYKAYDTNLDRTVAIKLMHAHFARQPEFRARLTQEARTAAQMEHPSIVRIYDFGESEEGLYIAMEYIGGGSLRAHLQRLQRLGKFLPLAQTLQIGTQIAEALDYAHKRGIIHRDVKPGNIILKPLTRPENEGEQPFRAMLTDFGLVKLTEGSVMTETGQTMGTPLYMSPEQSQGEKLDGRSDLYSLGVVLYELITNQPPFQFRTLSEALTAHIRGDMPPPASELRPDAPPLIDAILGRLLAKDPDERFESGEHTANILRSAIFSLADTPTRIIKRTATQDPVLAQAAVDAPEGFHLLIESEGRTANYMPLDNPIVNIGRDATNDMVLAAEGVSRHHVRLQATANGWSVIDLGGVNGTFLDGRRLRANELTEWPPGSQIQVGPYEITLERSPLVEQSSQPSQPVPGMEQSASQPILQVIVDPEPASQPPSEPISDPRLGSGPFIIDEETEPLGLFLTRERLAAEPGKKLEINAEVVNRTDIDDRVRLKLEGLPTEWINLPDSFVDLPANGSAQITIAITPPRRIDTPVGRQRFHISVVSQQFKNVDASVNGSLLLAGFNDFSATLEQKEITIPNVVAITIQNQGNTPNMFAVRLDEDEHIKMREVPQPIRLEPGTAGQIEVELESNQLQVFGTKFTHDYAFKVAAQTGQLKTVNGRVNIRPLLPVGVAYALLIGLVILCAGASITSLTRSRLFGGNTTPTSIGLVVNTATPTFSPELATAQAISATQMAVTISQTIQAATATAIAQVNQGDRDQDGLSDSQEQLEGIGSDPNNPDTDGDSLRDGDEVNIYGTSPTKVDTDADILRDNDEIFTYGTNPRLRDTDGDGLADGAEISQGSNPLDRNSPVNTSGTATATVTVVNTATSTATTASTATATTQAATATFTSTPTPLPTATTTAVPATATATATNTPIPATATATATLVSPTATATATATPTAGITPTIDSSADAFALACVTQPPILDGDLTVQEWGNEPLVTFQSPVNQVRTTSIYATRDTQNLYMAFVISGAQTNTDSLRVYIDTTNNSGDPDTSDRFFQIGRDGTQVIRAGIGSNNDGDNWAEYSSSDWAAEEGGDDVIWVIEMQVSMAAELGALSDPFGMGALIVYGGNTGETLGWPQGISSNQTTTWQDVRNVTCTVP